MSILQAVQQIRRMRGGSQAHLMRASDHAYYVVKYVNNPKSSRVLVNELFATRLGVWLGLRMAPVAVIEVSDWLIKNTPELRIRVGASEVPCRSGLQFASRYGADPANGHLEIYDDLPDHFLRKVVNLDDLCRCMVLDKWTGNADERQAIFTRSRPSGHVQTLLIDQGDCFNAAQWNFPDVAFHGVYPRTVVYEGITGWKSFEPALTRAEEADLGNIWRCAERIPAEWYDHDTDGLNRLVEAVYERRRNIRDLIGAFRKSNRNPFPNWMER
jgi:hypothetical protein